MIQLIESFARLPGVGKRTAERFALYVLSASREQVDEMAKLLLKVNENIHHCRVCFNLSEQEICHVCSDASRDHAALCVVQDPKDVIAIEKSGDFSGVYHVLMGALSPLEGIGPRDIRVKELLQRLKEGGFPLEEVNVGGIHFAEGKRAVLPYVYLDEGDREALLRLAALGVHLVAQDLPTNPSRRLEPMLRGEA